MSEDWAGDPARPADGYAGRPGAMLRLAGVESRLADIEAQFEPNHGSSIRDALTRIEESLIGHITTPVVEAHPIHSEVTL
jgi:hypothetical protein